MCKDKNIKLNINSESFTISQSEFWYFRTMLKKINNFYETSNNHSKAIMLKIPGTGKFRKINYRLYNAIEKQVNQIVESYTREAQIY